MDKITSAVKELFNKKQGKLFILLFAVGAAMLVLSFALPKTEGKTSDISLEEYKSNLEKQLSELCSDIEGAGKCKVMVSFSSGEVREYKSGVLISSSPPKIAGVTVLCKGGDKASVKSGICDVISALYGIGSNRICVLKLS